MREIKFRQAIFKSGKFDRWHYWDFVGHRNEFVGPITIREMNNQYEIKECQQYTGLEDKNGKEIYEGDIFNPNVKGFAPCVVGFNRGAFVFTEEGDEYNLGQIYSTTEVIGNIYETPELIEN